ncbi:unnamed protein product, partial [Staurois parvus]
PWCVPRSLFHRPSCIPGGRHLQCGTYCSSSAAHREWSCSLLGPVTCPIRLQGGREDTFHFRSPT